jgi:hypothetical protein
MKVKVNGHLGESDTYGSARNWISEFGSGYGEAVGAYLFFL